MDSKSYDGDTVHVTESPHVKFSDHEAPNSHKADEKEQSEIEQTSNGNDAGRIKFFLLKYSLRAFFFQSIKVPKYWSRTILCQETILFLSFFVSKREI